MAWQMTHFFSMKTRSPLAIQRWFGLRPRYGFKAEQQARDQAPHSLHNPLTDEPPSPRCPIVPMWTMN
jgi:hypothetical protein